MNIQRLKFTRAAFLFVLAMSLVGCGGGGGSSSTPTPSPSSTATISSASSVASQANTSSSFSSLSSTPSSASSSLESSSSSSTLIAGAVIVDKAPDVQVKVETAVLNSNVINADASLVKKLSNGIFIGEFNAPRSQVWAAGQIIMQDQQAYKVLAVLIDDDGSWLLQTKSAEISDVYKDLKFSVVAHGVGYDSTGKALPIANTTTLQKGRFQKPEESEDNPFGNFPCLKPTHTIELSISDEIIINDKSNKGFGYQLQANCSLKELAANFTLSEKAKSILSQFRIEGTLGYASELKYYYDNEKKNDYTEQSMAFGLNTLKLTMGTDVVLDNSAKAILKDSGLCKSSGGEFECEYFIKGPHAQVATTPVPIYIDSGLKITLTIDARGQLIVSNASIKSTKTSGYKGGIKQDGETKFSEKIIQFEKPSIEGTLDLYTAFTAGIAVGFNMAGANASLSYVSLSVGPYGNITGTSDLSSYCVTADFGVRGVANVTFLRTPFYDGYNFIDAGVDYSIASEGWPTKDCDSNDVIHIDYAIAGKKYYNYNNPESIDGHDVFDASYALIENTKAIDGTKQIIIDLSETKGIDGNPLGIEVYSPITSKNIFSNVIKNADGTHKAIISTGDITYGDTLNLVIKAFDSTNRAKTEVTRNVDVIFEKYFSATPKVSDEIDKDGNPIWFVTHNIVGDTSKITEDCISFASALDYCSIFSMFDPQYTWFLQRGNAEATKPKQLKFVTKAIEKDVKDYLHSFDIADEVTPKYSSITVSPNQVKVGDTLTLKITGLGLRGTLPLTMPNCSALVEVLSEGNIKSNNISTMERTFTCKATKAGENLFAEVPSALIMSNTFTVTATTGSSSSSSSSSSAPNALIPEFVPIPGKNFSMSKYETTFAQYDAYAEETGAAKPSDNGWGRGNRPVTNVNRNDAVAYAAWLSKKTGKNYRLPTEEEWEFSARAGTTTNYSWGDEIGVNNANCNESCGSQWDGKQTAPVGSFKPNAFGLFDIHGNLWEWTSSCFTTTNCDWGVLRGGSWADVPRDVRSSSRSWSTPTGRYSGVGFRLVQDTTAINLNSEPTNSVTVFTSLKLWATNAWEGITNIIWSFGDGLADASSSVVNGISDVVNAIFTTTGEKTITATFKDSANTPVAQRTTSITVVAASSSSSSSSAPAASLSGITPNQIIRNLTGSFDIAGTNLPTAGISVTVPTDPAAVCQAPSNMQADSFGTACTFKKVGTQTLEVRKGDALIGTVNVTVKTNVTGVTWASPSTTNSGTVKFGETVTYTVAGINLLEDATMGFAVEKCGVSNTEIGTPTNTQRTFQCFFNNEAGAVAGQMAGLVKDAPNGQVLFDGWNVAVEVPVIQVTPEFVPIPGKNFSMSKYETTFAEYDAYAEETGVAKPDDAGWGRGNRPVIQVSWNDAIAYAAWLSQKTGKNYRLPTEEEWLFAARAGTTTHYSWGDESGVNNANCSGCGSQWDGKQTAPAGSFTANSFGLFDMHGNVKEWTSSCSPTDCGYRMLRGGSWFYGPDVMSFAYRSSKSPNGRSTFDGFRLVLDNQATTSSRAGEPIIDLGTYGKLVAPINIDGKWFYHWDRSGNGSYGFDDEMTHDALDNIFTQDINGEANPGYDTTEVYRFATINGVRLALPTANGGKILPNGVNTWQWPTTIDNIPSGEANPTFGDLLAIWDGVSGTCIGWSCYGVSAGWTPYTYHSATPSAAGHLRVGVDYGYVDDRNDTSSGVVALQVL